MFSIDGLLSGLDTTAIVEGALARHTNRINRLTFQKQELAAEQTAFKTIEGQLLSLQDSMRNILRSSNNAFDTKTASSSDEDILVASATSSAVAGTYRMEVTSLAQAHQLASGTFANANDEINTGTLSIQVGSRAQSDITIDSTNNTWRGLVDAINASGEDVRAVILDDGSGSATPLRVLLTSQHTGSEHVINITNGLSGASEQPDFTGPSVQDAADAQIQLGQGVGAIVVSSNTNEFNSLVPGATIDAVAAEVGKSVTVSIEHDTQPVVDAVQGFVDGYNQVIQFVNANSKFDPETNVGGLLLGNRSATSVLSTLRTAIGGVVEGVNDDLRILEQVGISTNADGELDLDTSRLRSILEGEVDGVGMDDIRRLFAMDGQSDNPGIEFLLGTNNTQPSPIDPDTRDPIPFEIEITSAASEANLAASSALAGSTLINAANELFKLEIDNHEISVSVPHGSYTPTELADQLETLVNTAPDRRGRAATFDVIGGNLSILSATMGASSTLEILDGTLNSDLGLAEGDRSTGTNVAGVFRVTPPGESTITEQATGNGQTLTGDADNEYTAQLQIRSTLQQNQIGGDPDAQMTVTRGIGAALDRAIESLLNIEQEQQGQLVTTQDRLTRQIEAIDENIERIEEQMEVRRESLLREFAALESTLAELQSVGNALSSNLATLTL